MNLNDTLMQATILDPHEHPDAIERVVIDPRFAAIMTTEPGAQWSFYCRWSPDGNCLNTWEGLDLAFEHIAEGSVFARVEHRDGRKRLVMVDDDD